MMISTRVASFFVVALLGCLGFQQVDGQCESFGLAKYFGSKMVLQKSPQTAKIWGYSGAAGDQVTVSLVGVQDVVAVAESRPDGTFVWEAILDPVDDDTGSYTINIDSGSCSIQLTDVLFGDVWVCSGQSNMQFQMSELDNPSPDLDDVVNYPQVRTFFTELTWSDTPQTDLLGVRRTWDLPTRNNISPFSALCWLYGRNLFRKLNRPIGLIESNWGGTRIETWSSPDALSQCFANVDPGNPPNGASQLWNAMILPFTTIPIKGAIWYQGESNSGNAFIYGCALKAMVTDWRQKWFSGLPGGARNDFPFGQVQLAPWRNQDIQSGFPDVRWQQTDSLGYTPNSNMPGIFTAVAIDLPDYSSPSGDIHPRYKRQIADRLSLAAFQVAYGQTDVGLYQGPIPSSFSNDGTTVRVFYSTTLQYNNGNYFELCCGSSPTTTCSIGGQWNLATVSESNPNNLLLNIPCTGGNFVTGFRYNWRESPCDLESCAIYSVENNLPAPPFLYNGEILAGKMVKV